MFNKIIVYILLFFSIFSFTFAEDNQDLYDIWKSNKSSGDIIINLEQSTNYKYEKDQISCVNQSLSIIGNNSTISGSNSIILNNCKFKMEGVNFIGNNKNIIIDSTRSEIFLKDMEVSNSINLAVLNSMDILNVDNIKVNSLETIILLKNQIDRVIIKNSTMDSKILIDQNNNFTNIINIDNSIISHKYIIYKPYSNLISISNSKVQAFNFLIYTTNNNSVIINNSNLYLNDSFVYYEIGETGSTNNITIIKTIIVMSAPIVGFQYYPYMPNNHKVLFLIQNSALKGVKRIFSDFKISDSILSEVGEISLKDSSIISNSLLYNTYFSQQKIDGNGSIIDSVLFNFDIKENQNSKINFDNTILTNSDKSIYYQKDNNFIEKNISYKVKPEDILTDVELASYTVIPPTYLKPTNFDGGIKDWNIGYVDNNQLDDIGYKKISYTTNSDENQTHKNDNILTTESINLNNDYNDKLNILESKINNITQDSNEVKVLSKEIILAKKSIFETSGMEMSKEQVNNDYKIVYDLLIKGEKDKVVTYLNNIKQEIVNFSGIVDNSLTVSDNSITSSGDVTIGDNNTNLKGNNNDLNKSDGSQLNLEISNKNTTLYIIISIVTLIITFTVIYYFKDKINIFKK